MNLSAEIIWTLLRALGIAIAALVIGRCVARSLSGFHGSRRTIAWALLLAPALTPSIVIGYQLTRGKLVGNAGGGWIDAIYAVVLVMRFVPIVVVVLLLLPRPIAAEAAYCFRLLAPQPFRRRWHFQVRAAGRGTAVALTLIFLLAFTEFEFAALCNVRSWTVALFDAHSGGLPLVDSLRFAALPAAIEAFVLAALWLALRCTAPATASRLELRDSLPSVGVLIYLGVAALLVTFVPLVRIVRQAIPGVTALAETFALGNDLAASAVFGFGASLAAWMTARYLKPRPAQSAAGSIPGLLGALVLSLLVLALFQFPGLHFAYDTPVPLLLALTLLLLPLAVLLRWLLDATRPDSALFIARQYGRGELLWQLNGRRYFAAWALLFCWAFFDFTAASILAPIGFTPVFVRLHNLMHYGQTAVLSAMVCAAFATPVAVLLLTGAVARFYARRHGR